MKIFLLLAILTAVTGNLTEGPKQGAAHSKQEIPTQVPTNPSPVTVVIDNAQRGEPAQPPQPEAPSENTPAEWALVCVGIITFIVIGLQTIQTARATQAMQRSIALQEISLRQWVEIENWSGGESVLEGEGPKSLLIYFDVINRTSNVLGLEIVEISINGQQFLRTPKYDLTPNKPFQVVVGVDLTSEESGKFADKTPLQFSAEGVVIYRDVFDKTVRQRFGQQFQCVMGTGVFMTKAHSESAWVLNNKARQKQQS
jgi:hypothetical protein